MDKISIYLISQHLISMASSNPEDYLYSAFISSVPEPENLYLQHLNNTPSKHRKCTLFISNSLKCSNDFLMVAFCCGRTQVGCLWHYIKFTLKMLFDKVLNITRFLGYVQFLTKKRFQSIVLFI